MIFGIFVTQQCAYEAYDGKARKKDRKWSYISENFLCLLYKVGKNEKYAFQGGEINLKKKNTDLLNMFPKKSKSCNVQSFTVCTVYHDTVS